MGQIPSPPIRFQPSYCRNWWVSGFFRVLLGLHTTFFRGVAPCKRLVVAAHIVWILLQFMDLKNIQMKEIWKALKFNGHGHERRKERKERKEKKEKRKFTNMQRKSKKEEHNTINLPQTKPNENQFICYKTTLRHIYSQNYLGGNLLKITAPV